MEAYPRLSLTNHWPWSVPLVLTALLITISHYNLLLFHTLAELFAIGIGITITVVAWNMHPFTRNGFLMFLGAGYFWVAILDLAHTLTYKGVGILPATTAAPAIGLWLAARYLQVMLLVTAPYYLGRTIHREKMLLIQGGVAAVIALPFMSGLFPPIYIEGTGLTTFKLINEYLIIGGLLVAALLMWGRRSLIDATILQMILISIALTLCAELTFTIHISTDELSNLVGHIFKFLASWLIFLAMVQTTLEEPFRAMAKSADTYEAGPDATIVVDNDGIIHQANQAACILAERALPVLIGQHCHEIYHPTETGRLSCPVCQRIKHGEAASNIEIHSHNNDKFYNYALAPINNSTMHEGMVQTIRDVTLQKQAERLLKESERYNRMLFESSPTGLLLCRMNGDMVDANTAFAKTIGRTVDETKQSNYWEITPERYWPQELALLERLRQHGSYGPYEKEYLHKDGHFVPVRLNGMLLERGGETFIWSSVEDTTQQRKTQERLDFLAYHDPLTSMPNRLLLSDRLEHALRVAHRSGEQVAIMFIDLDRFKNINDSLGHAMGDQLLQHVANRLRFLIREQDTLARLGGDEFVIMLERIHDHNDVKAIAEKMMSAFESPFNIDHHSLYLTLSIGISLYPQDGLDRETLIRNADAAMYRSKESGRNSCNFYTVELTDTITEKLTLENALRNALSHHELVLHYQPQYDLDSGRLIGAEALIRWNHPSRGLLFPSSFIQLTEESGLIVPIGEWVIASACAQMCDWLAAGIEIDTIAVNVSGLQFQRGNLVTSVKEALQKSGLNAHHLELEITESIIMTKPEGAIAALNELKALGVMISIDDFGTGYSSLNQLKHLPVNKLKIDQSFVHDIPHDKNDEAIACAIIALGQSLHIQVSAEGVETDEQRAFLLKAGCLEGQGYLYSKPITNEDFVQLARRPHKAALKREPAAV